MQHSNKKGRNLFPATLSNLLEPTPLSRPQEHKAPPARAENHPPSRACKKMHVKNVLSALLYICKQSVSSRTFPLPTAYRQEQGFSLEALGMIRNAKNITTKSRNIFPCSGKIDRACRERLNCHSAKAFLLTGLPSSGKSTLAHLTEESLHLHGIHTYVFDGDNIRHGLCSDLGFSPSDRSENIRRVAEVIRLFLDAGVVCICAFISPLKESRKLFRKILGANDYFEIFIKCPVATCEARDVKGLYAKAKAGLIEDYTGISSPYEKPESPDLVIDTTKTPLDESVHNLTDFIYRAIFQQKKR